MAASNGTLIVVADGGRARFLINRGSDRRPVLETAACFENDNPPTREQGTDRPGRLADAGPGRSAVDDTDWHQFEKARFAREFANRLNRLVLANEVDRLVLIAPAKSLGQVRQALHKETRSRVVAEIERDLTRHKDDDIAAHVTAALRGWH